MGLSVVGIGPDSLLVPFKGYREPLGEMKIGPTAPELIVICAQIIGRFSSHIFHGKPIQQARNRRCDLPNHLILNVEDVFKVAVVPFGPQVIAGRGIQKLRRHAHSVACLAHAALDDILDTEFAPHVLDLWRLALVVERGIAGDDNHRAEARELGDHVLADAIGEILLLGVSAHVDERQHGDGGFVGKLQRCRLVRRRSVAVRPAPDADRLGDVLEFVFAGVREGGLDFARDLIVGRAAQERCRRARRPPGCAPPRSPRRRRCRCPR